MAEHIEFQKLHASEMQFLLSERAFRPIHPDSLFGGGLEQQEAAASLRTEFTETLSSDQFRKLSSDRPQTSMPLHFNKFSHSIVGVLEEKGLVDFPPDSEWLSVEGNAALLYMSLLAKHLAERDGPDTITGTDRREYLQLAYGPPLRSTGVRCLTVHLFDALPVPRPHVPLEDILRFRSKRREDLMRFREVLDDLQDDLAKSESEEQTLRTVSRFRTRIRSSVGDLTAQLRDARMPTILGSLTTVLTGSFLPPIAANLAAAAGSAQLPLSVTLPLGASFGALKLSYFLVDRRNVRRAQLRSSPYSYLYHADSRSVIRGVTI